MEEEWRKAREAREGRECCSNGWRNNGNTAVEIEMRLLRFQQEVRTAM